MRSKTTNRLTDDLFDRSAMTFGEHLEELRKTLLKAMVWLLLGTIVGLIFAERVVLYVKRPIEQALRKSSISEAKSQFEKSQGFEPPEKLLSLMSEHHVFPEVVLIDPVDEQSIALPATATEPGAAPNLETALSMEPWSLITAESIVRLRPRVTWRKMSTNLQALSATEPFTTYLKASLLTGVVLGSPGIFWHFWQFLAAGLYPFERRQVYWYLPLSLTLFLSGTLFAFYVLLQLVLGFLISYSVNIDVDFTLRLNEYMSFALLLPLGFGLAFQLPVVMLALNRFGVIPIETYIAQWRMAVLAIAFLSMILTPAEVITMLGMFIPLTGLYFLGIALCRYMPQGK